METMNGPCFLSRSAHHRLPFAVGIMLLAVVVLDQSTFSAPIGDFSGPRAYAILRTLAGDIGPRPMGSPAEQHALAFAAAAFKEYGCDTAYVLPMTVAGGVNTKSGVAIGVARGRTGRIIVIGGHIDSAGPDIPGANDDGSGAACVIELARVLAPRERQSTIVFCCFGGEEEGLRGSEYFVREFPSIDSVALMIQIDMADGASFLEMDPDAPFQVSAPRWLPRAAFDIYYNELCLRNLRYLTHTSTLNGSTPGGTGSDHMPFLAKGIPAIDFTSDVSYPIHSQLDNLATFDSSGLARSGLLAQRLAERFDAGTPSRSTEQYYLLQFGSSLVFVDHWVLWVIHVVTLVIAVFALVRLRRKRIIDRSLQPGWSAVKLVLATLILQVFFWVPESILGLIRGYRYPWVNNFGGFVGLALIAGAVGLWCVLRMAGRFRLHEDPYIYFLRVFIIFVLVTVALAVANPEIALYTGSSLLFFSIAVLVRHPIVKGALVLASMYLPLHLIFMEALGLFQRGMAGGVLTAWWKVVATDGVYVAVFTLLSLPFVFGMVAAYRSAAGDLFFLRRFRSYRTLLVLLPMFLIGAVILLNRPVYDQQWQRTVRAEQRYELGADSSTMHITGGEFLRGLHVTLAGHDTVLTTQCNVYDPNLGKGSAVNWVTMHTAQKLLADTATADSLKSLERTIEILGSRRPLLVEINFRSDQSFELKSHWSQGTRTMGVSPADRSKTLTWYAFPDSILDVPMTLRIRPSQKVIERVTITYPDLAAPVILRRDLTTITTRTVVTHADTVSAF
jgi:hypothetical protein